MFETIYHNIGNKWLRNGINYDGPISYFLLILGGFCFLFFQSHTYGFVPFSQFVTYFSCITRIVKGESHEVLTLKSTSPFGPHGPLDQVLLATLQRPSVLVGWALADYLRSRVSCYLL